MQRNRTRHPGNSEGIPASENATTNVVDWYKNESASKAWLPDEPKYNVAEFAFPDWVNPKNFLQMFMSKFAEKAVITMGDVSQKVHADYFVIHETAVIADFSLKRINENKRKRKASSHIHFWINAFKLPILAHDWHQKGRGTKIERGTRNKSLVHTEVTRDRQLTKKLFNTIEELGAGRVVTIINKKKKIKQKKFRITNWTKVTDAINKAGSMRNFGSMYNDEQYELLAYAYIITSMRKGKFLTVTFHREVDRSVQSRYKKKGKWKTGYGHNDPQFFDLKYFYSIVNRLLGLKDHTQLTYGIQYERAMADDQRNLSGRENVFIPYIEGKQRLALQYGSIGRQSSDYYKTGNIDVDLNIPRAEKSPLSINDLPKIGRLLFFVESSNAILRDEHYQPLSGVPNNLALSLNSRNQLILTQSLPVEVLEVKKIKGHSAAQVASVFDPNHIFGWTSVKNFDRNFFKTYREKRKAVAVPQSFGTSHSTIYAPGKKKSIFANKPITGYWKNFAQRAASIAEKEWVHWENGTKRESNSQMHPRLLDYWKNFKRYRSKSDVSIKRSLLSGYKSTIKDKNTDSKSEKEKKRKRRENAKWYDNAWSAAFISWVMREAGAGKQFSYSGRHANYMFEAKQNRIDGENGIQSGNDNPFWLYELDEVKPEVGDLICNWRSGQVTNFDSLKPRGKTHCDIIVEVDNANNLIWAIGGNTGSSARDQFGKRIKGQRGSNTVGKKARELDENGFVKKKIWYNSKGKKSSGLFAILKIRKNTTIHAPANSKYINAAATASPVSDNRNAPSSYQTINPKRQQTVSNIGGITVGLINQLTNLLNRGFINSQVFFAIANGNKNTNQLTDLVFFARHPERKRRPIARHETKAKKEWRYIKSRIIIPVLQNISTPSQIPNVGSKVTSSRHARSIANGFKKVRRGKGTKRKVTGLSKYADERLDQKLISMRSRGTLNITNTEIDLFQRIANVETSGKISGINTWDSGVVSLGFLQLTLKHGKIQKWIKMIPDVFKNKYKIELTPNKAYRFGDNYQQGIVGATKGELRWSPWAERFMQAGLDEAIIVAEIQYAREYIKNHLNRMLRLLKAKGGREYSDQFIRYYRQSPYLRGMFQAAYNNLPRAAQIGTLHAIGKSEHYGFPSVAKFIEIFKEGLDIGYKTAKKKPDKEGADNLIARTKNGAQFN